MPIHCHLDRQCRCRPSCLPPQDSNIDVLFTRETLTVAQIGAVIRGLPMKQMRDNETPASSATKSGVAALAAVYFQAPFKRDVARPFVAPLSPANGLLIGAFDAGHFCYSMPVK